MQCFNSLLFALCLLRCVTVFGTRGTEHLDAVSLSIVDSGSINSPRRFNRSLGFGSIKSPHRFNTHVKLAAGRSVEEKPRLVGAASKIANGTRHAERQLRDASRGASWSFRTAGAGGSPEIPKPPGVAFPLASHIQIRGNTFRGLTAVERIFAASSGVAVVVGALFVTLIVAACVLWAITLWKAQVDDSRLECDFSPNNSFAVVVGALFVTLIVAACVLWAITLWKAQVDDSRLECDFTDSFAVKINKTQNEKLGLAVHYSVRGRILKVESVSQGCVREWNKTCPSDQKILVGDLVLEVNGIRGDPREMLKTLRTEDALVLIVRHAPTLKA